MIQKLSRSLWGKIHSPTKTHGEWFGRPELHARRSLDKRQEIIGWPYSRRWERTREVSHRGSKRELHIKRRRQRKDEGRTEKAGMRMNPAVTSSTERQSVHNFPPVYGAHQAQHLLYGNLTYFKNNPLPVSDGKESLAPFLSSFIPHNPILSLSLMSAFSVAFLLCIHRSFIFFFFYYFFCFFLCVCERQDQ